VGERCETGGGYVCGLRSSRLNNPPFVIGGAGVYAAHVTEELANLGHQVVRGAVSGFAAVRPLNS